MAVEAWSSPNGLVEAYTYAPGRAGRDEIHVHDTVQVCLSWNFPGRYRSGRFTTDVPAGAVSVVDAWEPHAAEDPLDRMIAAHYLVIYVPKARWDWAAHALGANPHVGISIRRNRTLARAVARLAWTDGVGDMMASDEWLNRVVVGLTARRSTRHRRVTPDNHRLARGRDFIRAHAVRGVSLAEAAGEADLSPQHFSACFRDRYGVPPHRFQTLVRIDRARSLLAAGTPAAQVAMDCGFSDQSHLIRQFKRHVGIVPGEYRRRFNDNACRLSLGYPAR